MSNPKISVIIPVYNTAKYLPQCLDSVISQDFADIEIICVNDGSTDETLSVLKPYETGDKRIKIIDKANGGLASARNIGIDLAQGEYITFLDSDDWLKDGVYAKLYAKAKQTDADITSGQIEKFYENENRFEPELIRPTKFNGDVYDCNQVDLFELPPTPCNKLFKASLLADLRFNESLVWAEGVPFYFSAVIKAKKLTHIDDVVFCYRIVNKPNSSLTTKLSDEFLYAGFAVYDEVRNALNSAGLLEKYNKDILIRLIKLHGRVKYKSLHPQSQYKLYRKKIMDYPINLAEIVRLPFKMLLFYLKIILIPFLL